MAKNLDFLKWATDPDFYYLIGLICTDGNIRYPTEVKKKGIGYSCHINLNKQDKALIERIKEKFGGNIFHAKDNTIRWYISSRPFIEYLQRIGVTHNKSKTLNVKDWFIQLSFKNQKHFIRGVIDGDGSIKEYKHNFRTFNICSGSPDFYNMLKNYFCNNYPTIPLKEQHRPTYSYIIYNGKNMIKPLTDIYEDVSEIIRPKQQFVLYMKRKYETFKQIRKYFDSIYPLKQANYAKKVL